MKVQAAAGGERGRQWPRPGLALIHDLRLLGTARHGSSCSSTETGQARLYLAGLAGLAGAGVMQSSEMGAPRDEGGRGLLRASLCDARADQTRREQGSRGAGGPGGRGDEIGGEPWSGSYDIKAMDAVPGLSCSPDQ